ncbi:MAG: translation initiation factor IF-2 [Deltaproteobacteria bacterium]|nr:translation initiation factor IF-2 [Deltaproteobacteria bacterium]
MSTVRIYEIARELGIPNQTIIETARSMGLEVKDHLARLDEADVRRVKAALSKDRSTPSHEKRVSATVVRRRPRKSAGEDAGGASPALSPAAEAEVPVAPAEESVAGDEPALTGKPTVAPEPEVVVQAEPEPPGDGETREVMDSSAEPPAPGEPPPDEAPEVGDDGDAGSEPPPPEAVADAPAGEPADVEAPALLPVEGPAGDVAPMPPQATPDAPAPMRRPPPEPLTLRRKIKKDSYKAVVVSMPDPEEIARQQRMAAPPPPPVVPAPPPDPDAARTARAKRDRRGAPAEQETARRGKRLIYDRRKEQGFGMGDRSVRMRGRRKKERGGPELGGQAHIKRMVKVDGTISVGDLAAGMAVKASELIQKLFAMGVMATVNQELDFETAQIVAEELGNEVQNVAFQEETHIRTQTDADEDLRERHPVVTIMGHVDHGKTSLLDAIQKSNIAAGEAGGITQAIGAYMVKTRRGKITFIDTPGHEAFTAMRARGAKVTDIVILVVAADDGVMPQTREAVSHAKAAGVPIVVAVNKVDRPEADPQRVRQGLMDLELVSEEWGGETLFVNVSAKTRTGIDELLDAVLLQAEMLALRANPDKRATGTILESRLEKGRGPVATVLVQEGTLRVGDMMVSGTCFGKVRAMHDDQGRKLAEAGPSTPVEVLGLNGVPAASDPFNVVDDERAARALADHRTAKERDEKYSKTSALSLDQLFAKTGDERKEIAVVLKADSQGAVEALSQAIRKLHDERVGIRIIHEGVGGITEGDVNLAITASGFIIGFNVRPEGKARTAADQAGVAIRTYALIHEIVDMVKLALEGALDKVANEVYLGRAEVREIFQVPKIGRIAGSYVLDGKVQRTAQVRLIREGAVVWTGRVGSLRRFKDDAREVQQGYECGIGLDGFNDIKTGDIIESFIIEMVAARLEGQE